MQESCVFCDVLDVFAVADEHKERRLLLFPTPVCVVDEVSLLERLIALWVVVKVIKVLREVFRLITSFFKRRRLVRMSVVPAMTATRCPENCL